jgi:hypothetical protein
MRKIQPGNGFHFDSETKRYYLEYRYIRFREVKDYCREMNMTMIHIRNWKENLFVRELDNRNLIPIGIEFKDGRWKWTDGSELAYTNWEEWEPRCGSFCPMYTMYMKLDGRWIFDQEGIGIIACETQLADQGQRIHEQVYRKQLIQILLNMKDTLADVHSGISSLSHPSPIPVSSSSDNNGGYDQNQLPTIRVPIRGGNSTTRINP